MIAREVKPKLLTINASRVALARLCGVVLCGLFVGGCFCIGFGAVAVTIKGRVLDVECAGAPVNALFAASTFTGDEQTTREGDFDPDPDGSFVATALRTGDTTCFTLLRGETHLTVPRPDEIEVTVTRESLPLDLDIAPERRSGDNLLIACPCRQAIRVPITEDSATFLDPPADDASVMFVVELRDPILVPTTCESCCSFLVVRGCLANLADDNPRLSVSNVNADGTIRLLEDGWTLQEWSQRRLQVADDGTFEAWFSEPADACPPGATFGVPDRLDVAVHSADGKRTCFTDVMIDTLAPSVTVVDADGSFPRTIVELQIPIAVEPCPPG